MIKLIFFIAAFGLYLLIDHLRSKNFAKKKYKLPEEIKKRFRKISLPANKMQILTNDYYEEDTEGGNSKAKAIDALYDGKRNVSRVHKFASVIVYNDYMVMGKKYRLRSGTIDLAPADIAAKLKAKEMVDVYLDDQHIEDHYFDLSFLA